MKKLKPGTTKKCINPWFKYSLILGLSVLTLFAVYEFNDISEESISELAEYMPSVNRHNNVLIASSGVNLESNVAVQFETGQAFLIVNPETERYVCYANSSGPYDENWIKHFVNKNNVAAIITGTMNFDTFDILNASKIEIFTGVTGKAEKALKRYEKHELLSSNHSINSKRRIFNNTKNSSKKRVL